VATRTKFDLTSYYTTSELGRFHGGDSKSMANAMYDSNNLTAQKFTNTKTLT